jgi:hypothetical protein
MPQAIAAMGMKAILRKLLEAIGYKGVLISNTLAIGLLLVVPEVSRWFMGGS